MDGIRNEIPKGIRTKILIVDDGSPDGTGNLVVKYIHDHHDLKQNSSDVSPHRIRLPTVRIIQRTERNGLLHAILDGINYSMGKNILVMDADFSHPPHLIPHIVSEFEANPNCVVIGSRYTEGGSIIGMSFMRLIFSLGATAIARYGLRIKDVRSYVRVLRLASQCSERYLIRFTRILIEILVKKKEDMLL